MRMNTSQQNKVESSEACAGVTADATCKTPRSKITDTDLLHGGCCRNAQSIARVRGVTAEDDGRRYDSRQRTRSARMPAAQTCRLKLFAMHALTTRSDPATGSFHYGYAWVDLRGIPLPFSHPPACRTYSSFHHYCCAALPRAALPQRRGHASGDPRSHQRGIQDA